MKTYPRGGRKKKHKVVELTCVTTHKLPDILWKCPIIIQQQCSTLYAEFTKPHLIKKPCSMARGMQFHIISIMHEIIM